MKSLMRLTSVRNLLIVAVSIALLTVPTLVQGQLAFDTESQTIVQPRDLSKQQITFSFVNKGKTRIVITKIIPSCGCTIATATPAIINPGENGTLSLHLTSRKHPGTILNVIVLSGDDKTAPPIKLSLKIAEPPPSIDEQLQAMGLAINPSNSGIVNDMQSNLPFIIRISRTNSLTNLSSLNLTTNSKNLSVMVIKHDVSYEEFLITNNKTYNQTTDDLQVSIQTEKGEEQDSLLKDAGNSPVL